MDGVNNWPALITAIGGSTMGIISLVTQKPILAPQPTSILGAAIGGDLSTLQQRQQTAGLLTLVAGGALLYLLLKK